MNKTNLRNRLLFIGLPLVVIAGVIFLVSQTQKPAKPKYYEILDKFITDKVDTFELNLSSGALVYTERGDEKKTEHRFTIAYPAEFYRYTHELMVKSAEAHPGKPAEQLKGNFKPGNETAWLNSILPMLLVAVGIAVFWVFMMRRMEKGMGNDKTMSFGRAKVKPVDDKRKTTFADVAGADEEKEELVEIVEFLKNPKQFNELGARIPKGVLLVGPPGTGKTLLARAVAGEAEVPFFSISGSDFVEMFVGVGASRVRDLFEQAKKNSPAIIFIDEIDAVGRQRGAGLGGGHDEREQTLNQLLVEMDGFGANKGVIVIAATNRPDILDKALLRPGRFDRQVTVNYPDVKGREEILKVHARGKPLAPDVSLKTIAQSTSGFTGADLENVLNEAALLAARYNQKAITEQNIEDATIKVVMGTEKRSHVISDKDKLLTSYHEAGHAVVTYFLPTQDPVHQISIIPRGLAAGYTMYLPVEDRGHVSRTNLLESICGMLGGRAAEEITQDDICTGASNDIMRATHIAHDMIAKYGMSEKLGPIMFSADNEEVFLGRDYHSTQNYSEKVASVIDEEIDRIMKTQYEKALTILRENVKKLHYVAEYLFKNEKLDGNAFRNMMETELPELPVL